MKFGELSKEHHSELSAKGGKASGEARRRKAEKRKIYEATVIESLIAEGLKNELEMFLEWRAERERRHLSKRKKSEKIEMSDMRPEILSEISLEELPRVERLNY